jgi:lysozyme family protein
MKSNYEFCIKEVLKSEGGYTNDPADSGGETNFGITQRETSIPVKTMTQAQAIAIYKKKYWDTVDGDNLPSGVDYTVFDYGVNSGVARAKKVYSQFKDQKPVIVINKVNDERQAFLNNLAIRRPKDQKFLKGWTSRVARVRADSLRLVDKKDSVTGPVAGAAAGVGMWALFQDYVAAHPYLSIAMAAGVAVGIWALVHWIRNAKVD